MEKTVQIGDRKFFIIAQDEEELNNRIALLEQAYAEEIIEE